MGTSTHRSFAILVVMTFVAALTLGGCSPAAKNPGATTSTSRSALVPIKFSSLPHPTGISVCPHGYVWDAPANRASALCVPYAYLPGGTVARPNNDKACPAGAHLTMGPARCVSDNARTIVAPVP